MDEEAKKRVLKGFRQSLEDGSVPNSVFGLLMRPDEPKTPVEYQPFRFIGETPEDQAAIDTAATRADIHDWLVIAEDALCRVLRLYRIEVEADRVARQYRAHQTNR